MRVTHSETVTVSIADLQIHHGVQIVLLNKGKQWHEPAVIARTESAHSI